MSIVQLSRSGEFSTPRELEEYLWEFCDYPGCEPFERHAVIVSYFDRRFFYPVTTKRSAISARQQALNAHRHVHPDFPLDTGTVCLVVGLCRKWRCSGSRHVFLLTSQLGLDGKWDSDERGLESGWAEVANLTAEIYMEEAWLGGVFGIAGG